MTDITHNALKPCPFCGSEAEIEQYGDNRKSTIVACTECGCRLESGEAFRHGTFWNTRSDIAPDPLGAVKAKPLEWEMNHRHEQAASGYVVLPHPCAVNFWCLDVFGRRQDVDFPSPEAAKATAQADYENRIRSALEPCDPLADPRVVAADVDTIEQAMNDIFAEGGDVRAAAEYVSQTIRALATLSPTGGNDE